MEDLNELNRKLYSWLPINGVKINDNFLGPIIAQSGHITPNNFYTIQNNLGII